jgi:hypothetical protein
MTIPVEIGHPRLVKSDAGRENGFPELAFAIAE